MANLPTGWTLRGKHGDISGFWNSLLWVWWNPFVRNCLGKGTQICLLHSRIWTRPHTQSQVHDWMPRKKWNMRLQVTLTTEHPHGDFRLREGVLLGTVGRYIWKELQRSENNHHSFNIQLRKDKGRRKESSVTWLTPSRPSLKEPGKNWPQVFAADGAGLSSWHRSHRESFHSFHPPFVPLFHWAPSAVLSTKYRWLNWTNIWSYMTCLRSPCPGWWRWWWWTIIYIVHHFYPRKPWAGPENTAGYVLFLPETLLSSLQIPYLPKITGYKVHRQTGVGPVKP